MNKIQVGFLVSYDYVLLKKSIPLIYDDADTVFLAIDINNKTWNGNEINIDSDFFDWVKKVDVNNKIKIYKDNFFISNLTTMECEIRERKMLAKQMGIGNWIIQLDADEYFINFKKFVNYLKTKNNFLVNPEQHKIQIHPFHVTLYKKVKSGYLYVNKATPTVVATNFPDYRVGRKTHGRVIYKNALILHECLSRNREDLIIKLKNWGHNKDINLNAFMAKWDAVNENNYNEMTGFFFMKPSVWQHLDFIEGSDFNALFYNFKKQKEQSMYKSRFFIIKKNLGQFFKFHLKR